MFKIKVCKNIKCSTDVQRKLNNENKDSTMKTKIKPYNLINIECFVINLTQ